VTSAPAQVLGSTLGSLAGSCGQLAIGGAADVCVFDPQGAWTVQPQSLRSQGKHTPFSGYELPARVRYTLVGGHIAYAAA
jgi:dihydroorotase